MVTVRVNELAWLGIDMLGTLFFVVVWFGEESEQYSFMSAEPAWTTCFSISVCSEKAFDMASSTAFAFGIVVKQCLN